MSLIEKENFKTIKRFIIDSGKSDPIEAINMFEAINRRIARFAKNNANFKIIRTKSSFPDKSNNQLLVESGLINEKLEIIIN